MINVRAFLALLLLTVLLGLTIGWLTVQGTKAPYDTVQLRSSSLLPCPTEDSTDCYWDAGSRGNKQGNSFIAPAPVHVDSTFQYFTGLSGKGWVRISQRDADVLAESAGWPSASHRRWERCASDGITIICPDGHAFRWDNGQRL